MCVLLFCLSIALYFEIYDIGDNTLTINSLEDAEFAGEMSKYNDHAITIQGVAGGEVDLNGGWTTDATTTVDGVIYNVYHNIGATDNTSDLWIQQSVSVIQ